MKKKYEKPILCVERYAMTQSIAVCSIKIYNDPTLPANKDVLNDPDSTNSMKNLARVGGFISSDGCSLALEGRVVDGICFHTSVATGSSAGGGVALFS
ncbi:MAG: hypothetical protein IJW45_06370 [Oscillospiraceae bacterium]|nr:hypothetical protein [Oscillospiraceae bacterium]